MPEGQVIFNSIGVARVYGNGITEKVKDSHSNLQVLTAEQAKPVIDFEKTLGVDFMLVKQHSSNYLDHQHLKIVKINFVLKLLT